MFYFFMAWIPEWSCMEHNIDQDFFHCCSFTQCELLRAAHYLFGQYPTRQQAVLTNISVLLVGPVEESFEEGK
jgi:hypothetical protein